MHSTMKNLLVLLVTTVVCCVVHGHNIKTCLKPVGKLHFEHDKFAGDWYVIGQIVSAPKSVPNIQSTCSKLKYVTEEEGNVTKVVSHFLVTIGDKTIKLLTTGQQSHYATKSVIQAVYKTEETDSKWSDVFTQTIIATDYETFAILHACTPIYVEHVDEFDKFEVIEILGRTPKMEDQLYQILTNVLSSFDYNVAELKAVDNTSC